MRDTPASFASLPPELLNRIADFVPQSSLASCMRVSKAWLACFRPILWQDIELLSYVNNYFAAQFQLYYGFIRSLAFSIPSPYNAVQSVLGDPATTIAAPPGAKTLAHCTRLQRLYIVFDEDCYHEEGLDHDLMERIIDRVVKANLSTLQHFRFDNLPYSIESTILEHISKMTSLNSLGLQGWGALNGPKLLAVLKSSRSTLRTLSLEMNEMSFNVEPFVELQNWRAEVERGVKGGEKASADERTRHLEANLTGITTLILDGSTIDPITVTRLAGVMPQLRKLSFKGSYGLDRNMDHVQQAVHAQQAAFINSYNFHHMNNQYAAPTAGNNPAGSEGNDLAEDANEGAEEVQQAQQQEQENSMPLNHAPMHLGWNDVHDDDLDDDYYHQAHEDLGDEFEDYLGSGDEDFDYEHHASLYHAGIPSAGNEPFNYAHHQSLYAAGLVGARARQAGMLNPLHKLCPKIEDFDFSGCRAEGVDHGFLLNVCQLWGAGGLKVLDARDALKVENTFFSAISINCSTTLTGLDLSWNHSLRTQQSTAQGSEAHMPFTTYYDEILNIMTSCPHLEYLHVEPYPVNGRTIQHSTTSWVCTKLKSLKINIGIESSYAKDEDEVRIAVCKQLGRLVHLQTLHLESAQAALPLAHLKHAMIRNGLRLSLAGGLDHLAGLEHLESLDISRMVPHSLREEAEMDWIVNHWPALNHLMGLLDRDALSDTAKGLRTQLGPPAQFMPASTPSQGFARQNALKKQRAGVPLPAELDLERNPLSRRLRDRGINVDPRVMDEILLELQMQTVAQADRNGTMWCRRPNGGDDVLDEHGNKPPPQMFSWVVCYVPNITHGWGGARPGGRSNEEFMSYVMRPRGGRSPSPLGTWY
ncbi:hypothetical protein BGZ72_008205 [Mortierella alpina]|nr:hypothetical protein BGZ72_008205 [Mortierella alpina]